MEAVACQRILTLQDLDPTRFCHDDNGASHSAVRASAAADRIEAVAERHLETHRAAVALASPNVRVINHVAVSPVQSTSTPDSGARCRASAKASGTIASAVTAVAAVAMVGPRASPRK